MLKKRMTQYLEKLIAEKQETGPLKLEAFKEEKDYIEKHMLLSEEKDYTFVEKDALSRFNDIYIERCDKESEELLAVEKSSFLDQPIGYFKNHLNEFIYTESPWFDLIGADAISFEVDSVFGLYDVMLGLKIPKKEEAFLKSFLSEKLKKENGVFSLMFNQSDGLWDLNFALNDLEDFNEDWTLHEAFCAIFRFLFMLAEAVEAGK